MRKDCNAPSLPPQSGVSLKAQHYHTIIENNPPIGWFEIHPENYMGAGGPPHQYLAHISNNYPLSMHGVGMSLGCADGVSNSHLARLKQLIDRYQPAQVSEHLSWSHGQGHYLNDLLPLPYTEESLQLVSENICRVQDTIGRHILVENPSNYLSFKNNQLSEPEFFEALCQKTGCGILLDINNIAVTSHNNSTSTTDYLDTIPLRYVGEIHLAGHTVKQLTTDKTICIDDHGSAVGHSVWQLFEAALSRLGKAVPTLIEWDTNSPDFEVLLQEAETANTVIARTLSCTNTSDNQERL